MAFNKVLETFLRFLDHVDMMVPYRLHTHNDLLFSHRPMVELGSGDYSEYSELIIMLCDVVQYDQGMDVVSRLAKILFVFFTMLVWSKSVPSHYTCFDIWAKL